MKKILLESGVTMIMSPTNIKEWNGLAEQGHGQSGRTVTSIRPKAWEYSDLLHNFESCMISGKEHLSRLEATTGERPNLNKVVLLPFGQPVEYFIGKALREGSFSSHCYPGIFVGASDKIEKGIQVYNIQTKVVIHTANFSVMEHMPDPYTVLPKSWFNDTEIKRNLKEAEVEAPNRTGVITRRAREKETALEANRSKEASQESLSDATVSESITDNITNGPSVTQVDTANPKEHSPTDLSMNESEEREIGSLL